MKIGITIGDINGIGPEVIIKALSHPKMTDLFTPIIYGSNKVLSYHRNIVKDSEFTFITISNPSNAIDGKINIINCWEENVNITLGKATEEGGRYAHISLDRAVTDLSDNKIDALVTSPINKKIMENTRFNYPGHTEFLSEKFGVKESLMTMVSDQLKVALITNHVPIAEVSNMIRKDVVISKTKIFFKTLIEDFGIERPSIALLGLNPHAGELGKIGKEEIDIIAPAVADLKKEDYLVFGPFSADGHFGSMNYKKFDGTMAMYHDQGLIAFKAICFGEGVNYTAGLPVVRTSPDHGTGYDIAGQNIASPESLRNAIFLAIDVLKNRNQYKEMQAISETKKPKLTEEVKE